MLRQRSISNAAPLNLAESNLLHKEAEEKELETKPQTTKLVNSLGCDVQLPATDKPVQTNNEENLIEKTPPETQEHEKRRRKSYDTMSIGDSTIGKQIQYVITTPQ